MAKVSISIWLDSSSKLREKAPKIHETFNLMIEYSISMFSQSVLRTSLEEPTVSSVKGILGIDDGTAVR